MKTQGQWYTPDEVAELHAVAKCGGFIVGYFVGFVTCFIAAMFAVALWPWN